MAHTIVIFGASGDLTSRKLIPALYELYRKKRLPKNTRDRRASPAPSSADDAWREKLGRHDGRSFRRQELRRRALAANSPRRSSIIRATSPTPTISRRWPTSWPTWKGRQGATRVYYLSTAPQLYARGHRRSLARRDWPRTTAGRAAWSIEKPFGTDLATARELNEQVHEVFAEQQVYRIDHYLGKETVQNVLVLRFANSIFEPIWNRNYIDHVQITAAEDLTVGHRAAYYDSVGVLRDMFQNHLLQLMTLHGDGSPRAVRGRRHPRREGEGACGRSAS